MDIRVYADGVDDIIPVSNSSLEVSLSGVDVSQLVQEIINESGPESLLELIPSDDLQEYMNRQED